MIKFTFFLLLLSIINNLAFADQAIKPGQTVWAEGEYVTCDERTSSSRPAPIPSTAKNYCACEFEYGGNNGYRLVKGTFGDDSSRVNIVRSIGQNECTDLLTTSICNGRSLRTAKYCSCDGELNGNSGFRAVVGILGQSNSRMNLIRNIGKSTCIEQIQNNRNCF